jgi:hypothetical protein
LSHSIPNFKKIDGLKSALTRDPDDVPLLQAGCRATRHFLDAAAVPADIKYIKVISRCRVQAMNMTAGSEWCFSFKAYGKVTASSILSDAWITYTELLSWAAVTPTVHTVSISDRLADHVRNLA